MTLGSGFGVCRSSFGSVVDRWVCVRLLVCGSCAQACPLRSLSLVPPSSTSSTIVSIHTHVHTLIHMYTHTHTMQIAIVKENDVFVKNVGDYPWGSVQAPGTFLVNRKTCIRLGSVCVDERGGWVHCIRCTRRAYPQSNTTNDTHTLLTTTTTTTTNTHTHLTIHKHPQPTTNRSQTGPSPSPPSPP